MKILKSLLVWVCFIPVAILNGGLREHVLARALGEKWALPLSGIILSACIFLITWLLLECLHISDNLASAAQGSESSLVQRLPADRNMLGFPDNSL